MRRRRRVPREGIKVHGHWIIEVKNPDGSRADYREFDNHLVAEGGPALARILGIQTVPATWFIWIGSNGPGDLCQRTPGNIISCGITTPIGAQGGSPNEFFPNLQMSVPTSGPNAGKLVFSGSATSTSPSPSTLNYVLTQMWMCPSSLPAGQTCFGAGISQANITRAELSPAVPIQPGQVIQVTVIISFS